MKRQHAFEETYTNYEKFLRKSEIAVAYTIPLYEGMCAMGGS